MIRRNGLYGDNENHGDYPFINMHAWTNEGRFVAHRSLIEFDLTELPADSIYYATLKLYSDRNTTFYPEGHIYLQDLPQNELVIYRITEDWEEYEVTWNNRPDVTFRNEVFVPATIQGFMDVEVDVTDLVIDMLDDPDNSHGFMIQLLTEFFYARTVFASSDNEYDEFHPRLEVGYKTEAISENSLNNHFKIYPNPTPGVITVVSEQDGNTEPYNITIVNSLGKEIISRENINQNRIGFDLTLQSKGVYYLNIYRNDLLIGTEKIIVQ